MYRLLVADDERLIRLRLALTYDWAGFGVDPRVLQAENGAEALRLIAQEPVDIVVTDIRMPDMDGLEMLENLRARRLNTRVIIISGYSDFKYAQKALRLGATAYILKPIDDREFLAAIRDCVSALDGERPSAPGPRPVEDAEYLRFRRRRFYLNLLGGKYADDAQLRARAMELDIALPAGKWLAAVLAPDPAELPAAAQSDDRQAQLRRVQETADAYLAQLPGSASLIDDFGQLVCIFHGDAEAPLDDAAEAILTQLRAACPAGSALPLTIGIGRECRETGGLSDSYTDALNALRMRDFLGGDKIYRSSAPQQQRLVALVLEYMQRHYKEALSLQGLAAHFHLSEAYFCRVFSAEAGEAFTKRLMRIRVDAAKRLLADPTIKIYEVSSLVGYQDPGYFARIFKEYTGMTPLQYRNRSAH